jgi:hypothetical protein
MIRRMKAPSFLNSTASLALLFCVACGDKPAGGNDETGTGDETATDATSDEVGESGTTTTSTTSTDDADSSSESPTTDDDSCPIGAEGCPCTDGGGCDPGLSCEGGICEMPSDTTETESTTDTTDATETDTTDTTDTTGGDPLYQACPSGDDSDCAPGEICVTGNNNGMDWSMCTSGECGGDDECAVDDDDFCSDLPGDGEPIDYCVPLACSMQNPCPMDMFCAQPFGMTQPVCVWGN